MDITTTRTVTYHFDLDDQEFKSLQKLLELAAEQVRLLPGKWSDLPPTASTVYDHITDVDY
jgi:hypothetical protein